MGKHIQLSAILNIIYRSFSILGGIVLIILSGFVSHLLDWLVWKGEIHLDDLPAGILEIVAPILALIGVFILCFSILAIIGAVGVMKRKEWARILLLVVSFFTLLRIPLGTLLGAYTIWVLLNDETIREFNPLPTASPPIA